MYDGKKSTDCLTLYHTLNKTAKKDQTWMHAIEIISAIVSQTQNNESSRMFLS